MATSLLLCGLKNTPPEWKEEDELSLRCLVKWLDVQPGRDLKSPEHSKEMRGEVRARKTE